MKKTLRKYAYFISIFLAIIMLLPCFSFGGITAGATNYTGEYICISFDNLSDGKIAWAFDVGLNTQARGLASEDEKGDYRVQIQNQMLQVIFAEKRAEYQAIYDSIEDEALKEKYNPEKCITYTHVIYDQQTDSAGFKYIFADSDSFNFYNGGTEAKKNLFITRQTREMVFPFAKTVEKDSQQKTLAQYYRSLFISACSGLSIENSIQVYNPDFIFDYETSTSRVRSNADMTYTDQTGQYHHAWGEKATNINDSIIVSIVYTTANRGWWYLFGTAIPLAVMGVVIAIIVIKDRKQKKNKPKENLEETAIN